MLTNIMYTTLYTADQDRALTFYTEGLGLEKRVDGASHGYPSTASEYPAGERSTHGTVSVDIGQDRTVQGPLRCRAVGSARVGRGIGDTGPVETIGTLPKIPSRRCSLIT